MEVTKEEEGMIIKDALECFVEILDLYVSNKDDLDAVTFSKGVMDCLEKYGFVGKEVEDEEDNNA